MKTGTHSTNRAFESICKGAQSLGKHHGSDITHGKTNKTGQEAWVFTITVGIPTVKRETIEQAFRGWME